MKKIFCCGIYLLFLIPTAHAQANIYHPFAFDQNPEWRVDYFDPYWCGSLGCSVCSQIKYFSAGDTIVEPYHYYKIFVKSLANGDIAYKGLLREDTAQKKVYVLYDGGPAEILLYDFDLQINDTVYFNNGSGQGIVESIDSVLIGTEQHKRFNFFGFCGFETAIIEGVGSNTGLFEPFDGCIGFEGVYDDLKCFKQNGILEYQDTFTTCTDCDFALGSTDLSVTEKEFFLPNPASDQININYSITKPSTLTFINTYGKVVKQLTLNPSFKDQIIYIESLPGGIYWITLREENKTVSKKLVVIR